MATSLDLQSWTREVVFAGLVGGGAAAPWSKLADEIDEAWALTTKSAELLVSFEPELPAGESPAGLESALNEMLAYVFQHGKIGFLAKQTHRSWAQVLKTSSVQGRSPASGEELEALLALAQINRAREAIGRRWSVLVEAAGGPAWREFGDRPEMACHPYAEQIRRWLCWADAELNPLVRRLGELGLRWPELLEAQPAAIGVHAQLEWLDKALRVALPAILEGRLGATRQATLEQLLEALVARLRRGPAAKGPLQTALSSAVLARDPNQYEAAFRRVETLRRCEQVVQRRNELLASLEKAAPEWAEAIRHRTGPHGLGQPPGDPCRAWEWTQLNAELERRANKSLPEIQQRLERLERRLREVSVQVIEGRAWLGQLERTTSVQQQALVGWLDLVRRIGKGTGKRAPQLRAKAARQMQECRTAVPVWIMPLSRVAETFDGSARFDVVIVDEASQCDVLGLVALYLARSVVVVGDHEQVSPAAVGQQLDQVTSLIDQYLEGIPNKDLYDGKTSIYDLARQSFGGLICLTEHFRCYPQIIEFSNWLSYEGRIKPLREPNEHAVRPFTVAYRVPGAARDPVGKVNRVEAEHVASLLVACTKLPEYNDASFGVVSLLGDEQARVIDELLRSHLSEAEYARRRVLCGNAAQFQGDERDVMMLSVVHTADDGPLPLLTDTMYRQRFNVAASRARDQMWVVHSLDVGLHLKPGDLRRRLIEHALDPTAKERELEKKVAKTESDFERRVLEQLVQANFKVTPQYQVGAFRIDMIVEGEGGRLAVECDGEQFHGLDKLEEDLARQAILERLGWTFVRIRGSVFYRDPIRAMHPVFKRLAELGISPRAEVPVEQDDSGVRDRVIRRAEALRRLWAGGPEEAVEDEPPVHQSPALPTEKPELRTADAIPAAPAEGVGRTVAGTLAAGSTPGHDCGGSGPTGLHPLPSSAEAGPIAAAVPDNPAAEFDLHSPAARREVPSESEARPVASSPAASRPAERESVPQREAALTATRANVPKRERIPKAPSSGAVVVPFSPREPRREREPRPRPPAASTSPVVFGAKAVTNAAENRGVSVYLDPAASGRRLTQALFATLAEMLPAENRECPECHTPLMLTVSHYGPYLKCRTRGCKGKRSLPYELISAAPTTLDWIVTAATGSGCGAGETARFSGALGIRSAGLPSHGETCEPR